jgi:hypothetical protein
MTAIMLRRRLLRPLAILRGIACSVVNALIGAYLNRIGLSYKAIIYITQAPPNRLRSLTARDRCNVAQLSGFGTEA